MTKLVSFAHGNGSDAFEAFKRDNSAEFPQYIEEMRGIAEGAGVSMDSVWCFNLIAELESLMSQPRSGHCSDIYAVSADGYAGGFAHGHNEDWPGVVHRLWYFVKYTALPGANFENCAGMVYPGTMLGWTPGWNSHGLYQTMNSLYPKKTRRSGLSSAFIQREALCGRSTAGRRGLDAAVATLARPGWAAAASTNVVDFRARRMASVETHEDAHAVREVTEAMGNYSHFNMYKNLQPGVLDAPSASTLHRQARVDSLPPPRGHGDVVSRLSDTADEAYPVFRVYTLGTFVLDGDTGVLSVWCCGRTAASGPPTYAWNLTSFWEAEQQPWTVMYA